MILSRLQGHYGLDIHREPIFNPEYTLYLTWSFKLEYGAQTKTLLCFHRFYRGSVWLAASNPPLLKHHCPKCRSSSFKTMASINLLGFMTCKPDLTDVCGGHMLNHLG